MKVIFLDIDGVFNSELYYKQRPDNSLWGGSHEFDPETVKRFNEIIDATDAKIVVSSAWRKGDLKYLQDLFKVVGLKGEVIGETEKLRWECEYPGVSIPRGLEIKQYYAETFDYIQYNYAHKNDSVLKSYVIIDDDSDMLYEQRNNFVCVNSFSGLIAKDVKKAIMILQREFTFFENKS